MSDAQKVRFKFSRNHHDQASGQSYTDGDEDMIDADVAASWESYGIGEVVSLNVDVTDAAMDLAQEHGLDLREIEGTGSDGKIIKSDVEDYIAAQQEETEE